MNCQVAQCGVYIRNYAFIILSSPYTKSSLITTALHRTFHCHWAMLEIALFLCFDLGMKTACHISCKSVNIFLYRNIDRAVSLFPCSKHQIQCKIAERVQFDREVTSPKAKKGTVEKECTSVSLLTLLSEDYYAV